MSSDQKQWSLEEILASVKIAEVSNDSLIVLTFRPKQDTSDGIREEANSLSNVFGGDDLATWCKEHDLNPLCIVINDGSTLDVLNEEDMNRAGWYRKAMKVPTERTAWDRACDPIPGIEIADGETLTIPLALDDVGCPKRIRNVILNDSDTLHPDWRLELCGICNRHICECAGAAGR